MADRTPAGVSSYCSAIARVTEIDPITNPAWDAYVRVHPKALAYHLGAWAGILATGYAFRPRYLAAVGDDGRLRGVLPLIARRGVVRGRRLHSLPGVPVAGPLGDSLDDELLLVDAACELARRTHGGLLMIARTSYAERRSDLGGLIRAPTWILRLPDSPDELLARWGRGSNVARSVRKSEKAGLSVRLARSAEDLATFYRLYLLNIRKHGALPTGRRQLRRARAALEPSGIFRLYLVEHEGSVVAGGLFHVFNGTVELLYNASLTSALSLRPNHALYWHIACMAIEEGHGSFDFGGAWPHEPLGAFKSQWGAEPVNEYAYQHPGGEPRSESSPPVAGATESPRLREQILTRMPLPLLELAGRVAPYA